jgi:serine/threonine-protein kinase
VLLEPGQIFASRYRVVRCVAEGGMGAIFEAEHLAIERRVALKLLFPHVMSMASARKKFELEARISARVNSPHIVEVLDAGFDESSKSAFLVMELLEGQTLAARICSSRWRPGWRRRTPIATRTEPRSPSCTVT